MVRLPRAAYTPEFKLEAVKLVEGGRIVAEVARELGLLEQTLRNWVNASRKGKLVAGKMKPVAPEQMEMSRLRAENARLKMENDILKKATAYFAKDVL
jgi:transposase